MFPKNSLMAPRFALVVGIAILYLHCVQSQDSDDFTTLEETERVPKKEEWYPKYHLAPLKGWMNDPNGLIAFGGYYHAFFQHNPYDPEPIANKMGWGHARSKDLIHWEHLPMALSPSRPEDKDGCFSGSAVNNSGTLTLVYTGNAVKNDGNRFEVQCIATSKDTKHFKKHGKVLSLPGDVPDFRDPKVWKEGNYWYMVVGYPDGTTAQVVLYRSRDLHHWQSQGVLARADEKLGFMWECPDFFPLGDKHVLSMSPQGVEPDGYDYRNLYQSGHFIGTWRPGGKFNIEGDFTVADYGHDFYAHQTFLAPDGRRIMIAWMNMWEGPIPEAKQGWAGMFTLPRELSLSKRNKLIARPCREAKNLRHSPTHTRRKVLNKQYFELDNDVTTMEITMIWNLTASDAEKYGLRLGDRRYREGGVYLYVDNQSNRLVLDRRYPQYGVSGYRSMSLGNRKMLSLHVFFDSSSIEVFINNGEATMSSRIFPSKRQRSLSIFAENGSATLKSSNRWVLG